MENKCKFITTTFQKLKLQLFYCQDPKSSSYADYTCEDMNHKRLKITGQERFKRKMTKLTTHQLKAVTTC